MKNFPHFKQPESKDCGPTCLKIVAKYFGKNISVGELRNLSETTREGSSLLSLSDTAEKIGFRTLGIKIALESLKEASLPCILHWNENHYVVLYKVKKNNYYVSDPSFGLLKYSEGEFLSHWIGKKTPKKNAEGIALLIESTPKLKTYNSEENNDKLNFGTLFQYVFKYKKLLVQLILGLLAGSVLQLFVPFLTQSIVDVGIKNQDINFVYLILFAQLALFIGRSSIEIIRSWILLHLSVRINISLISDFFIKLMDLPISYFDTKMTGDILQRINDHRRIEQILTTSSLNILFSLMTFFIFSFVLIYYSPAIFMIFLTGSVCYFLYILIFLKRRKELDYKRFSEVSDEQSKVIELINGMQEIKLHNAEKKMRWNWEHVQASLFKISIKNLALEQYQSVGSGFINESKNIFLIFYSAKLVITGDITFGMMLAISYIAGQLNAPIQQFISFVRQLQDAKISMERLSEIYNKKDETQLDQHHFSNIDTDGDIELKEVDFRYIGSHDPVLRKLNLTISSRKVTAIVGESGSGKTTLMKMLLKFYDPTSGEIKVGDQNLKNVSNKEWRNLCGVVMQEGYIFNDTIAQNIAVGSDRIDYKRLEAAAKAANIHEFISNLPMSYTTKIGMEGMGLSSGQKQRLLIARAVYKDPQILFFDEATSALDANNEKVIMQNLNKVFENKTVVVIAHRLSTVKNADQIIVLDSGKIIELGTHNELVASRRNYYNLVKNQLELGT